MNLLKGVMDVAETGVRTLGAAASTGSKPLLDMLEPQSTSSHVTHMSAEQCQQCYEAYLKVNSYRSDPRRTMMIITMYKGSIIKAQK